MSSPREGVKKDFTGDMSMTLHTTFIIIQKCLNYNKGMRTIFNIMVEKRRFKNFVFLFRVPINEDIIIE